MRASYVAMRRGPVSVMPAGEHTTTDAARTVRPPWPWRAASALATLGGAILLALVLAHWGWRAFAPTPAPSPLPETPERWTTAIVAAPLFGRPSTSTTTGPTGMPPAPATLRGDARLLGVVAERGGGGYALFRLPDRGPVFVGAGQEIANDVTLESVRSDGVRIRDHGEARDLMLRATPAPASSSAPPTDRSRQAAIRAACAAPAGYTGPVYRLNAELLTGIASQPESWKALFAPSARGLAVRDASGFAAMLGMKIGDRVAEANGIALSGVDDVLTAVVRPLLASHPVRLAGTRDGKPAEWLFVNAGACPG
jgi:hypothetical protein